MKILCIAGKARHGKDTCATFMKSFLEKKNKRVLICHYGDLVKYVCKTFFNWDGHKDKSGRQLLQFVGTDIIRSQDENYWVDFLVSILTYFNETWDYVLIPDCRFPNEINEIKKLENKINCNVYSVRVERDNFISDLTEGQQHHISETALDDFWYDHIIYNDGTLTDLNKKCVSYINSVI